jgi:predicted  nucleic acid-binding Zn-ribbon protein
MMIDYMSQTKLLKEKRQQEMEALLIANEGRLSLMKWTQEKEVSAARQRVANLENEMKNAKSLRAFAAGYEKMR